MLFLYLQPFDSNLVVNLKFQQWTSEVMTTSYNYCLVLIDAPFTIRIFWDFQYYDCAVWWRLGNSNSDFVLLNTKYIKQSLTSVLHTLKQQSINKHFYILLLIFFLHLGLFLRQCIFRVIDGKELFMTSQRAVIAASLPNSRGFFLTQLLWPW